MDSKKIIIIITLTVLIFALAGLTIASNLTSIGGTMPETAIAIEGIDFNIPDGYEKDNTKSVVNETRTTENTSFVLNQESYENSNGEEIIISIADYDDFDVDADTLSRICEGADGKSMMGYPGYIISNDTCTQFTYAFDHRAVSITAPNEDLINQILIVEDA